MTNSTPTERFTGRSSAYAKNRPDYPESAIQAIIDRCLLRPGKVLADIGSGTGISSRLFAERGLRVLGIEPNDEMRRTAESQPHELIGYREGTGEETGLAEDSADAVLCAQAFHWLNAERALTEFHRILKADGWVILMWNERDERDEFTHAYGELLRSLPETTKVEMRRGSAGEPLLSHPLFSCAEKLVFHNHQRLTEDGLLGRAFSTSYVPQTFPDADVFADRLKHVFSHYNDDGIVTMHYSTSVYLAKKAPVSRT